MSDEVDSAGLTVAMDRMGDPPGVDIIDPVERRRCTLITDTEIELQEGDPDTFRFPVETAIEIQTTGFTVPATGHVIVRDQAGTVLAEIEKGSSGSFEPGTYSLELTELVKVYLHFEGRFSVENAVDALWIGFPEKLPITIGARSSHTRPATTVTTTNDPTDILAAISTFGSALKTTSPERSFPTLRGHPPLLEIGDELTIPDGVTPPVEDVRIEVPPRYDSVYPVAPLAYYLGVKAEPGPTGRIVGPDFEYSLGQQQELEHEIHSVLKRVFLLECVNRTDGLYPLSLRERNRIEKRVDLPFDSLYAAPLRERLPAYLDVPEVLVDDLIPDWRLAAHVDSSPQSTELLPYLANELALVTMADPTIIDDDPVAALADGGFTRGSSVTASTVVTPGDGPQARDIAWAGLGTPIEATKALPEAYQHRQGRNVQHEQIEIAVICNDAEMSEERNSVDAVYGGHGESLPLDVSVYEDLERDQLASVLQENYHFLHYIGHIDSEGVRCPDGRLDLACVSDIGAEAFFLNACQSYDQGLALIENGAIGGIVTVNEVVNHGAVRIGQTVAKLLDNGFPLRAALTIASDRSVIGRQYLVVGDGTLSIVEPPSGTPQMYLIEQRDEETFEFRIDAYGAPPGMGCVFASFLPALDDHYLADGDTESVKLESETLRDFLEMENVPVLFDEQFCWSGDLADRI